MHAQIGGHVQPPIHIYRCRKMSSTRIANKPYEIISLQGILRVKIIARFGIFALSLLALCSPAKAELLGIYIHEVNKSLALEISLSDTTKAEIEVGPSECEKKGMWRVLTQIAAEGYYPQMLPYASGCWYAKDKRVWIEATTVEKPSSFKVNYSASTFKTMDGFKGWSAYGRYTPITFEQAKSRKQREDEDAAAAKAAKEYAEAIGFVEKSIRCDLAPFPHTVMARLVKHGLMRDTGLGSRRVPIYEATQEVKVFGRKLLFVSGGGQDGSSEDFRLPARQGITYIPTHFAITVDAMPDLETLMTKREGTPPFKSRMQFVKEGALDGSDSGVTLICGYRLL